MKILVTGAAGFIGSKICKLLVERGDEVVGLDNINDYYDTRLKAGRLYELGIDAGERADLPWGEMLESKTHPNMRFVRLGIEDKDALYFNMREQGILGRRYFYPLISDFSTYRGLPSATSDNLPVATKMANEVICLPMHHKLTEEDVSRILNCIAEQ